jgi:hypothetical protein
MIIYFAMSIIGLRWGPRMPNHPFPSIYNHSTILFYVLITSFYNFRGINIALYDHMNHMFICLYSLI